jgi:protocatechuate 3,4-dioxygenase beta subunit
VLTSVPAGRRTTLVARADVSTSADDAQPPQNLVFDIRLQGADETVFFAL